MNTPTPPQRKPVGQEKSDRGFEIAATGSVDDSYEANRQPATARPAESDYRKDSGLTAENFPVGHEDSSPQEAR